MTARTVITWPDPRLLKEASYVKATDAETTVLAQDLYHTMISSFGAGIAAPQVAISKAVCVISSAYVPSLPRERKLSDVKDCVVLVNPVIKKISKEKFRWDEACLSVPDITASIERIQKISLKYENLSGTVVEKVLEGIESATVQHETDHLIGKLFIHRLTGASRQSVMRKLRRRILSGRKKNRAKNNEFDQDEKKQSGQGPKTEKRILLRKKRQKKKKSKTFGKNKR